MWKLRGFIIIELRVNVNWGLGGAVGNIINMVGIRES